MGLIRVVGPALAAVDPIQIASAGVVTDTDQFTKTIRASSYDALVQRIETKLAEEQ